MSFSITGNVKIVSGQNLGPHSRQTQYFTISSAFTINYRILNRKQSLNIADLFIKHKCIVLIIFETITLILIIYILWPVQVTIILMSI